MFSISGWEPEMTLSRIGPPVWCSRPRRRTSQRRCTGPLALVFYTGAARPVARPEETMKEVILVTGDRRPVARVTVPDFKPEVIIWGQRFFVPLVPEEELVYREAMA